MHEGLASNVSTSSWALTAGEDLVRSPVSHSALNAAPLSPQAEATLEELRSLGAAVIDEWMQAGPNDDL